jgi:tellurite resistance protein
VGEAPRQNLPRITITFGPADRPEAPRDLADRLWVPAGSPVRIGGHQLTGGMIYVGAGLPGVGRWSGVEPALIDPHLPCTSSQPDREGRLMSYWPSYAHIQPASRAAYLEWLAGGRCAPDAYIGYVFLFFYGIERRVLADAQWSEAARSEAGTLLAEVERLLGIYGGHRSFRAYAEEFLTVARLRRGELRVEELRPPANTAPGALPLRLALGRCAADGRPVPAEWALAWLLSWPEVRLRTPAQRCKTEVHELFALRYREAFPPEGMKLKPNKTRLAASYRPASASFHGSSIDVPVGDLPDVSALTAPLRKLQEIVDQVSNELDVYSRWVGRTGEGTSPAALALLPPELARTRESDAARGFSGWVEKSLAGRPSAVVACDDLFARWPLQTPGKIGRRDLEMLSAFLAGRGYGVEPDVRCGGPAAKEGKAVLFRLPEESGGSPGPAYHAAAVLLHLAATVSAADGEVSEREERHLLSHLEKALHLGPAERARLEAHLRWLLADPPGLAGLKKRIEPLQAAQRHAIGQFLITVAGADGHVSPEELKLLTRIYGLLGLDPQTVYSDVHALAAADPAAEAAPAAEPVTVRPATPGAGGFAIPASPPPSGLALDLEKIRHKSRETEQVSALLEEIFATEEEPARPSAPPPAAPAMPAGDLVAGLDAAHSTLLRQLAAKTTWERLEIERLTAALGLLPDGALEILNEAAFSRCGAPLLEGDELIDIDPEILEELLA